MAINKNANEFNSTKVTVNPNDGVSPVGNGKHRGDAEYSPLWKSGKQPATAAPRKAKRAAIRNCLRGLLFPFFIISFAFQANETILCMGIEPRKGNLNIAGCMYHPI